MSKNKETSWENVASWYDELLTDSDSYQNKVILPNILRLVEPKKGLRVIDVGCGQGFFSEALSKKGAEVIGVDISKKLLELARTRCLALEGLAFYQSSAEDFPKEIKKDYFNTAISILAIQNMAKILDIFTNISDSLKTGGKFFMVLNHPSFRIPKRSSWGFDEANGIQYRRVDGYLSESKEEILMHPGSKDSEKTISFHRPLQTYVKSLHNSGFAVSRIEEWTSHKESEEGPRKKAEDRARKEIPIFMCIEAVKIKN